MTTDHAPSHNEKPNAIEKPVREFDSQLTVGLGVCVLLLALVVNPWLAPFWRNRSIYEIHDGMLNCFCWGVVLGLATIGLGVLLRRFRRPLFVNMTVLYVTLMLLWMGDRLLLAKHGYALWTGDVKLHFRHRPNTIRNWGASYGDKLIRINRYGQHDDEFPLKKQPGEFRALMLGDSITMGHGVTRDETFSNQLERMLTHAAGGTGRYQIINTGVQGYCVRQEFLMLEESLRFEPDFITIGFCMNDVTEPYVVDRRLGGAGTDFHGVWQTFNPLAMWAVNETGLGRAISERRKKTKAPERDLRRQAYNIGRLWNHSRDDPKLIEAWEYVLKDLERIYQLAASRQTPVLLIVFPETDQILYRDRRTPQEILKQHANRHGVDVLDCLKLFEPLIVDQQVWARMKAEDASLKEFAEYCRGRIGRYYLDHNHLTPAGHIIVAERLAKYLRDAGLAPKSASGAAPPGPARQSK